MNHSLKIGLSFGLTSAVITTLGLIIGLNATTASKLVIIGGIITIAIADAFSDALGIHVSEESENKHTSKEIWMSTFSTFLTKFIFALTFVVPILFLELGTAIIVNIIWGLLLLTLFSYYLAVKEKTAPWKVIGEHLLIAVLVIIITNYVGQWVATVFV